MMEKFSGSRAFCREWGYFMAIKGLKQVMSALEHAASLVIIPSILP